ncbi:MAG: glycoside hydrolase family 95 protein [Fimbriimonas sp.]|nr:glycoside hydrolase family 95 protein [Fimbriimonas sp.]
MLGLTLAGIALATTPSATKLLWYKRPADQWIEALPVGNGRLGAMVFGRPADELIQLNESTVWTGAPYDPYGPGSGAKALKDIQGLVFEGKGREAEALYDKEWMSKTEEQAQYQPLGDLRIQQVGLGPVSGYGRDLNLETAVSSVRFKSNGVNYKREVFASAVDHVIVVHIEADKPGSISLLVSLDGRSNYKERTNAWCQTGSTKPSTIYLNGQTASYADAGGLRYEARVTPVVKGGTAVVDFDREQDRIKIDKADSVTLYVAASTNYANPTQLVGEPDAKNIETLSKAVAKPLADLYRDHVADYRNLFDRIDLDLGVAAASNMPTDERFDAFQKGKDPAFPALYFNFGRYLLISCSRPGGTPPNLQGIWNADMNPAWGGKFTSNINFEMNYWPSESANLPECEDTLWKFIPWLTKSGGETAKRLWGARGWVLGHNTDQWASTAPIHGAYWAAWHGGAAWLCSQAWEHYRFSEDQEFLRSAYPWFKGVAEFFMDTLVTDPKTGLLVTNPSSSPENGPGGDKAWKHFPDGSYEKPVGICAAPAIDMWMLREFFDEFEQAASTLGQDPDLARQVKAASKRLAPVRIGKFGQIQEWQEDLDLPDDHHRHVSQLWGLFPGTQVSPRLNPDYAKACRVSLEQRGDEASGWSMAWKTCLWARLGDGDHAFRLLKRGLQKASNVNYGGGGSGTYPNLFDTHPPFQIDGNLGGVRAICEMLVQGHTGTIELLPALPSIWKSGSVRGLRAPGGFEIAMRWTSGNLESASIQSTLGGRCRVLCRVPMKLESDGHKIATNITDGILEFETSPGATYTLSR